VLLRNCSLARCIFTKAACTVYCKWKLRSANTCQLVVTVTAVFFSVHGPTVWNSLPYDLHCTDISLDTFENKLKTFLFDADTH